MIKESIKLINLFQFLEFINSDPIFVNLNLNFGNLLTSSIFPFKILYIFSSYSKILDLFSK